MVTFTLSADGFFVKSERAVEIFKGAVQPAVAQMLDAEIDERMLAFFINFIPAATAEPVVNNKDARVNPSRFFFSFLSSIVR